MKKIKLTLILLTFLTQFNIAQPISQWRGENRDGIYTDTNLLKQWPNKGPKLLWYNDSLPKSYASVAVANNLIYTTGVEGEYDVLVALDLNGKMVWKTAYGRKWDSSYEDSRSTPTVEGNSVYMSSGLGDIASVNALTGKLIWQVKAKEVFNGATGKFGYAESLLIVDNKVIASPCGESTTMVALDKSTGETIWKTVSLNENPSYTSPLLINRNGKQIITTLTENYLIGVESSTGELLWKFNFGEYAGGSSKRNNQTNTPIYHDGNIFITSGYDHKSVMLNIAEDAKSVSVKWVDSVMDVHHGGVCLIDGYLYGSNWTDNRMGNWVSLDWESGKVMYDVNWYNKGSIISADGMLYCYEEKSGNIGLVPVTPNKFEVKSTFKVPYGEGPHWSHLVINNGILYVRHGNALMAYDIKNKN